MLAWIGGIIAILILLVIVAAVVLLHSARGHRYILGKAQQMATAALGAPVHAREFTIHWSGMSPTVDMYNVVVAGAPPYPTPPLLTVDRIQLGITVSSLLHRSWYINEVRLDHPVVRVFVDRHGTDNLPQTKKSSSQSNSNVFDLGIRHALLDNGEIYYNNRKSALDADLHDLEFRSTYDTAERSYSGTLAYRNGHLAMGTYQPIVHSLNANWKATPQAFTLQNAVLSAEPSHLVLNATLSDYANPKLEATYDALLDAGQFRRVLRNPSLPSGLVRARGTLHYASRPNVPMMDAVDLNGDVSSGVLVVATPSFRGNIRDFGARYTVAGGNADIRDLHARLLGGELTGTMAMRNLTGATRSNLHAALRGVSLADLKSMMNSPALRQVSLTGTANAVADASWGKTTDNLVARTDATLQAKLSPSNGGGAVPLSGAIHARYAAASKTVSLSQSYLRMPQTSLTLDGTVANRSALRVQLQSSNLHELETVAGMFRASTTGQPAQPLDLYGTASFNGQVTGSTAAPHITGQLNAANLRFKGTSWRFLRTAVDASPSRAALQNGNAQALPRGNIRFDLVAGLQRWAFAKTSPFQARLNASQLDVAQLAHLAGSTLPVSGTLSANLAAGGTELSPMGHGNVHLSNAVISGQPVRSLKVDFQGTGTQAHATLAVNLPAGSATGNLVYFPQQQTFQAQLQAIGIKLQQLQAIKERNMDLKGVLNLTASGRGSVHNPQLQASLQIPQLQVSGQNLSAVDLQAAVANKVASFNLNTRVIDTAARAHGTVQLTGAYMADIALDTKLIPFAPLVAAYAPSQAGNINGQTEIHGTLRGPLKNKSQVDAHLTIPVLTLNYKNTVNLAAAYPIRLDYTNGVLQLQRSAIRGTDTNLEFQGTVPVVNRAAPASLLLLGNVNLRIAQLFSPDLASSGEVRFNINSYGQRANPDVQGQVQIVNANLASGSFPIGLQNGNGVLTLTKDRLNITQFHANIGGGDVNATGGVAYRPQLRFNLGLSGNGIRFLYPGGIRAALDTDMALAGSLQHALLRGQVNIDQMQFTPDFDLMTFMGELGGGATTPPPTQGFSDNLNLDVALTSGGGVQLVSRTMSLDAVANMRLAGTASQPVILGRVNLNGGDLIFQGNRYVIQGGTIDFVNATQTQPVVNVAVNTTINQYDIQMHFWGPADHLHTSYASDPALPPSDVINLIAFGKTTEASAANPTPPGSLGAESLVASQVSSQVTNRVEKIAGISQLSIDPVLGGSQQTPGARVAIQQRVTSKLFVTFATDVTSTQRSAIKFEYHATPRKSYNLVRDQNGGFSFETQIRKTW